MLRDWRRAAELYGVACEGSVGEACVRLARLQLDPRAGRRGVPLDSATAARLLMDGCDRGAPVGCTELGDMYVEPDSVVPDQEPTGVLQDLDRARSLYGRACDGGGPDGCARLGALHLDGNGVDVDAARAAELFGRGCDGGSMLGCAFLGSAYAGGLGVDRDPTRAVELLERSCEVEMEGCFRLAELLLDPAPTGADAERAVELLEKACTGTIDRDEGSPPVAASCFRLGDVYANGSGVERDVFQASRFFRRACNLGYQEACRRS